MKKWLFNIWAIILSALFLCSCQNDLTADYYINDNLNYTKSGTAPVYAVDNTTPYEELITKEVDIHNFVQTYTHNWSIHTEATIYKVADSMGIECLRLTEAGALYSVHKVKQGGLLYTFYENYDWTELTLGQRGMMYWFYVREKTSYKDFGELVEGKTKFKDVINAGGTTQIFENIFFAKKEFVDENLNSYHYSWYYLEDGILELVYLDTKGELVLYKKEFKSDFDLRNPAAASHHPYNARILDMDWVK